MSKKKIIILGKLPPPYIGPSIATKILLESDLKNRFELIHLNTKINDNLQSFGKISLKKLKKNLSIYKELTRLIKQHKPDLVLVPISQTKTGFIKDSIFISIAHKHKVKTLVHLRGSEFGSFYNKSSSLIKSRINNSLKKCAGAIVLGNNLRYIFKDFFPKEKIFVVPNGGNYSYPQKQKSDKVNILFFSNLLVNKGVYDVFRAINILHNNFGLKNFTCDFVGAWYKNEDRILCEELLKDNPLPLKVHQPCGGDKKLQFFADADVFVFPPREPEGHPWSIVEAMAAALPVISTDKGAIIESVSDGKNGFIVNPASPLEIAEKLKLLIENEVLRKSMGDEGKMIYLANFTEEKMVDNLTSVFNEAIL